MEYLHSIGTGFTSLWIVFKYFFWLAVIVYGIHYPIWDEIKGMKHPNLWYVASAVMMVSLLLYWVLHLDYVATGVRYNETMYRVTLTIGVVLPFALTVILTLKPKKQRQPE